jgi:hypothetical protein
LVGAKTPPFSFSLFLFFEQKKRRKRGFGNEEFLDDFLKNLNERGKREKLSDVW